MGLISDFGPFGECVITIAVALRILRIAGEADFLQACAALEGGIADPLQPDIELYIL